MAAIAHGSGISVAKVMAGTQFEGADSCLHEQSSHQRRGRRGGHQASCATAARQWGRVGDKEGLVLKGAIAQAVVFRFSVDQ